MEKYLRKIHIFDDYTLPIFIGNLSASVAMFFSTFVALSLKKIYDIYENPFIDAIGVILGTIFFIFLYIMYNKVTHNKKTST